MQHWCDTNEVSTTNYERKKQTVDHSESDVIQHYWCLQKSKHRNTEDKNSSFFSEHVHKSATESLNSTHAEHQQKTEYIFNLWEN